MTRQPEPLQVFDRVSTRQPNASWASSATVRRCMQSNKPRDNRLELAIRSAVHGAGLRYRTHVRPVSGVRCEADLIFTRRRIAVFIDGCFWHACPEHATWPATNAGWWRRKIEENAARDRRNDTELRQAGWTVLRIWEHEGIDRTVNRIVEVVGAFERSPRVTKRGTKVP